MKITPLLMFSGVSLVVLASAIFIRFWNVTGTETRSDGVGGQTTSGLDWASFFASPFIAVIGASLIAWALLLRPHKPHVSRHVTA